MAKARKPLARAPAGSAVRVEDADSETRALVDDLRGRLDAPETAIDVLGEAPTDRAARAVALLGQAEGGRAIPLLALTGERADASVARAALVTLGTIREPAAAGALAQLGDTLADRDQRKEARRALAHLRSRGVAPPTAAEPVSAAGPPVQPRATPYRAIASHSDGMGSRALWLLAERPLGGAYLLAFVLNDQAGIKDAYVRDSTRRRLAAQEAEMRDRADMTWVELPIPYAQWLIHEALALNAESGVPVPTDYRYWRDVIGEPPETIERPLAYEEVSRFEVKMRPELLRDVVALFREPEMEGWLLGYREVRPYVTELRRARESRLVLSAESEEQRNERVVTQAIRELFTPALRRAVVRRLEETAYVFLRTERAPQAKVAIAAAVELADTDPVLLSRHPFVRALVERSIELAIRAEQAGVDPSALDRSPYDPIE